MLTRRVVAVFNTVWMHPRGLPTSNLGPRRHQLTKRTTNQALGATLLKQTRNPLQVLDLGHLATAHGIHPAGRPALTRIIAYSPKDLSRGTQGRNHQSPNHIVHHILEDHHRRTRPDPMTHTALATDRITIERIVTTDLAATTGHIATATDHVGKRRKRVEATDSVHLLWASSLRQQADCK